MRRRWCGRWISSSSPPSTVRRSRSRRRATSTRESPLNLVERSIAAKPAHRRAGDVSRRRRRPADLAADGQRTGVHLPSAATVLRRQSRTFLHPAQARSGKTPTSNRSTTAYAGSASTPTHWTNVLEAGVVNGDFKHEHNTRHRDSVLGYPPRPSTLPDAATRIHPVACEIN
jgi:hypothetical protein